ncbi:hypothetical protein O3P69_017388 [Scylla paramamosain]|uniref:Ribosome production factor 2 homolog n=1 Tax=Scylla paramamosain TaxID=85552 RepID=A0AAW0SGB3_SCYPA
MGVIQRVVKPRNSRSKRALEKREPKNIENTKQCLFFVGKKASEEMRRCLRDLYSLRKHHSLHLSRKHPDMAPCVDILPVERLGQKHDASLFCYVARTKKHQNNMVIGRMFNHHLLDLIEVDVSDFRSLAKFNNPKGAEGTKPCLTFAGPGWEDDAALRTLKSLLLDLFRGVEATAVRLQGFELALQFVAVDSKTVMMRGYSIHLKKSGLRTPRIELDLIGPCMTLHLQRSRLASDDLMKRACRQPKQVKANRVKNISKDVFGSRLGRIHMTSQDLGGLQTRKLKGLKKVEDGDGADGGGGGGGGGGEEEQMELE